MMFEKELKIEKKGVEKNMRTDKEFDMLLGQIPHASSPLNFHPTIGENAHQQQNKILVDHGYSHIHSMYDDLLKHNNYAYASSPVSGFSLQSDNCSSSLFSDIGSPPHLMYRDGFRPNFNSPNESNFFDDFNLCGNFSKMHVSGEQDCVSKSPNGVIIPKNLENYGGSDNYTKGYSDRGGFNRPMNFEGETIANLSGSPSDFGNSAMRPRFCSYMVPDTPSSLNRPHIGNIYRYASQDEMNPIEANDAFYPPNVDQFGRLMPHYNVRVPQGNIEPFTREDGLIIQGMNRVHNARSRGHSAKKSQQINNTKMFWPLNLPLKCSSLAEARGYIYHMAKDQHGCRFLQRMFDEGTPRDVQMIFSEIICHVVELMMNPFGNYLMQKLLEVCDEEQRMHILMKVTGVPGELVRISLNTHGTRVVQKLIETLKVRQQISLVISALEPGFLVLIQDLNGNHVVQRCLHCFTTEDCKFIFVAATKYCIDIATHQHGCCVLQRCISGSTGELRKNLISEISANGLMLAQDAYGNYVVQFILDLEIPSVTAKLTSQFDGNYVHLSTQKFSSHVVEHCLKICNGEIRSKIIKELLFATCFEQLLQDPHANYVLQTALNYSEGRLHDSLVDALGYYKAISRSSPYTKGIFSHKLLKR